MVSLLKLFAQNDQEDKILSLLKNADLRKMEFLKSTVSDNVPLGDSTLISTLCDIYYKSNDEKIKRGCALTLSILVSMPTDQYGKPTPRVLEIFIDKMVDTTFSFNSPHIQNIGQSMLNIFSIVAPEEYFILSELKQLEREPYNYKGIQKLAKKWYSINEGKIIWDSEIMKYKLN